MTTEQMIAEIHAITVANFPNWKKDIGAAPLPSNLPITHTAPVEVPKLPFKNSEDAFWASQAPELQALRAFRGGSLERMMMANLLKGKFPIVRDIHVMGNDPLTNIKRWIAEGYVWFPGYGDAVEHPALPHVQGAIAYNPAVPRPGSMMLSLDFAKGYGV